MQSLMIDERRQLNLDMQSLDRRLCEATQPVGLKQRAKFAFLKQLHAYKRDRREELGDALKHARADRRANAQRIGRI